MSEIRTSIVLYQVIRIRQAQGHLHKAQTQFPEQVRNTDKGSGQESGAGYCLSGQQQVGNLQVEE